MRVSASGTLIKAQKGSVVLETSLSHSKTSANGTTSILNAKIIATYVIVIWYHWINLWSGTQPRSWTRRRRLSLQFNRAKTPASRATSLLTTSASGTSSSTPDTSTSLKSSVMRRMFKKLWALKYTVNLKLNSFEMTSSFLNGPRVLKRST